MTTGEKHYELMGLIKETRTGGWSSSHVNINSNKLNVPELVLNVLFLNVQGLNNKSFIIEGFILGLDIAVICISEHWLRSHEVAFFLP